MRWHVTESTKQESDVTHDSEAVREILAELVGQPALWAFPGRGVFAWWPTAAGSRSRSDVECIGGRADGLTSAGERRRARSTTRSPSSEHRWDSGMRAPSAPRARALRRRHARHTHPSSLLGRWRVVGSSGTRGSNYASSPTMPNRRAPRQRLFGTAHRHRDVGDRPRGDRLRTRAVDPRTRLRYPRRSHRPKRGLLDRPLAPRRPLSP